MAPGIRKTFRKLFRSNLAKALEVFGEEDVYKRQLVDYKVDRSGVEVQ